MLTNYRAVKNDTGRWTRIKPAGEKDGRAVTGVYGTDTLATRLECDAELSLRGILTPAIVFRVYSICRARSEGMEQAAESCTYLTFTDVA